MRKRKWLLIVVIALIMINLVFWGVAYLFDVNSYVKNKLTNTVGKQLGATISFSALNVTSKILQLTDIEVVKEGEYSLKAKQLYIYYSFWDLILHNFKVERALKEVRCFSPELMYVSSFSEDHTSLTFNPEALEKILTRVNYISIINGKVDVQGAGNIIFTESLDRLNINLQKQTDHEWHITFSAFQPQHEGVLEIEGDYARQSKQFSVRMKDYQMPKISMKNLVLDNALINANINTDLSKKIAGTITISDIEAAYHGESLYSDLVDITITPDSLTIEDFPIRWKNHKARCGGYVYNYLNKNSVFDLSLALEDFDLKELTPKLSGTIDIKGNLSGCSSSPRLDITLSGEQCSYDILAIDDLSANLAYQEDVLTINEGSCLVDTNKVTLSGDFSVDKDAPLNSSMDVSVECRDFSYLLYNIDLHADAMAKITGELMNPECNVMLNKLIVRNEAFLLPEFSGMISYRNKKADFNILNPDQSMYIKGFMDISSAAPLCEADIFSDNLVFVNLLKNEPAFLQGLDPHIDTNIRLKASNDFVSMNGQFNFEEKDNPALQGEILIKGEVPIGSSRKNGYLDITSDTLKIHNEPVNIAFQSRLTQGKRFSAELGINRSINADVTGIVTRDSVRYSGHLVVDSLHIERVNNIFSLFEKDVLLGGMLTARFDFEDSEAFSCKGDIYLSNFSFNNILHPFDVQGNFDIDASMIALDNILVRNSQSLLAGKANMYLPGGIFEFNAVGDDIILEDMYSDFPVTGRADYSLIASGQLNDPRILCNLSVKEGSFFGTAFDSFESQVFQDSNMFYLKELDVLAPDFIFSGNGTYSYNFITEEFHNQPDSLTFHFSGDLLEALMPYVPDMKNASSKTELMCSIKTEDTNTIIDSACVCLTDGEFSLKAQPEGIRDFTCDIEVKDNVISMLSGSLMMGDGRLYFKNKVHNDDSDIFVGDINVGTLLLNNDEEGITVHIPKYQPERGLVDARLTGFDSDYFSVYNEDGGWVLSGKILLSNGDAFYEKGKKFEEKDEGIELPPIYADFDLVFNKNIWYVANPFNLKIDAGNYMSFRSNRKTEKLELFFDLHSRQGEMRLFGESFSAEDVFVRKARKDAKVFIDATFTKRTPDGSTISLYVKSTEDKLNADNIGTEAYGDVEVTLKSDNPKDVTMLSILSKLQYGKEIDELSEEERFDLGTEQAINLASDQLSNLIFSPLISPVEGMIRQFLGLDYVRFKTGVMKNIILTSGIVESDDYIVDREYDSDLELLGELSKDILLENLTIDLGKYITPEWYLNYEALIKREMSSMNEIYIDVEHELSFTWDLPYNFRFIYKYQFYPAQGKDNQGISLETVIHF